MARRGKVQELTPGEWDIMRVVWEIEPCAAPAVQEALHERKKWAYTTVKTMMDRMAAKGFLKTEKIRNLTLYRSVLGKADAQRGELARTLKQAFEGALTPMMQFLLEGRKLTEKEIGAIEAMIRVNRRKT